MENDKKFLDTPLSDPMLNCFLAFYQPILDTSKLVQTLG